MEGRPNQIVIIGGGATISEGIEKGLWEKIQNLWTIGLNYNYLDFKATMNCYVDPEFYDKEVVSTTPTEIATGLKDCGLIVGSPFKPEKVQILPNTIQLKNSTSYKRDLSNGVYNPILCGLWALSLAIYLLDEGEIYLLGYDFGEKRAQEDSKKIPENIREFGKMAIREPKTGKWLTHYYQGQRRPHGGIGKVDWYNIRNSKTGVHNAEKTFGNYKNETKCKIYNVSMNSKINTFPQITYDEFFTRLSKETYNQNDIREYIKQKLLSIPR